MSRPVVAWWPAALGVLAASALGCGARERGFDEERAFGHLVAQVELGPRAPGSPGHRAALDYYVDHLEGLADRVTLHSFEEVIPLDSTRVELNNVIAVFGEDEPFRICFAAHWDTRGRADEEADPARAAEPGPGANDGASGVAVLLEVATALAASPPGVGVDLVLFDGEDGGVAGVPGSWALGSQRFVRDHPGYRPAFVVVIDMVGRRGLSIPKEGNSVAAAGSLVEAIWAIGREIGLTVLADSVGAPVYDDHIPFLEARIPAVDLISLDDPDWHTLRDLPENCAPESLGEIGRLLLALVARAEATSRH